jgi:hypothetical protein
MSTPGAVPDSVRHAKTDLYDTEAKTFYIQYPVWFVVLLALAGVVAFAVTGFLGYGAKYPSLPGLFGSAPIYGGGVNDLAQSLDHPFSQPWVLYLWLCVLVITLVASILRDASLRGRLYAMLLVSLLAAAVVGVFRFGNLLPKIIQQLLNSHVLFQTLSGSAVTYTVVNFGLIAIFWSDTIRRWFRYSRGMPLYPRVDIGLPESERGSDPRKELTFTELISGDLIAAAILSFILALIFRAEVLGQVIHPTSGSLTTCTVSLPGPCTKPGGGYYDMPTLTFVDIIQALVYLPLGLIILALAAVLSGLGAVHAVDNLDLALASTSISSQSSTAPITEDVTLTLFKALRSAFGRRGRNLAGNFVLSLRWVGWPALLFVCTFGISEVSIDILNYLHSSKTLAEAGTFILPAAIWGVIAVMSVVISIALMLFRFRVVDNTLRFLGLIGLVALLTFWIFSLALWGFNQLIIHLSSQPQDFPRHPFDPPSFSTLISLAALLLFGVLLLFNNARQGGAARRQPAPAVAEGARVQANQLSYVQQADATQSAQAVPSRQPATFSQDAPSN